MSFSFGFFLGNEGCIIEHLPMRPVVLKKIHRLHKNPCCNTNPILTLTQSLGGSVDITQKSYWWTIGKKKRTSGSQQNEMEQWGGEICVGGSYSPANEKGPFHETPKTRRVGALARGRRSFSSVFEISLSPKNRNLPFLFFYSPWTQEHPRDRVRRAGRRTDSTRPLRQKTGKTNRSEQCGAG